MKLYTIAVAIACVCSSVEGFFSLKSLPTGSGKQPGVLTKSSSATSLFALLASTGNSGSTASGAGSIRNLDATDGLVVINDASTSPQSRRRLDQDRDYTLQAIFCHGASNSIQSYHSYQPSNGISAAYNPLLPSNAQGQCGKYIVKSETIAKQVGCNPQNSPNGCNSTYVPGCGGISINPTTKDTYVARTGGRTIGKLVKVTVGGTCESRVVDWLVRYRGKQFNGPSDVTFTSKGNLYFSDSPFALATTEEEYFSTNLTVLDSKRELPFNGVYLRPSNGANKVIDCTMTRPKSIAFSPKEDVMYVSNADANDPYIKSFQIGTDGTPTCSQRFFNMSQYVADAKNASCSRTYPTGIKVDNEGFVYVAMCRNIYVIGSDGKYVGRLEGSGELHNLAFSQGYLYVTASNNLYALPLDVSSQSSQNVVKPSESCDSTTLTANAKAVSSSAQSSVGDDNPAGIIVASAAAVGACVLGLAAYTMYKRKQPVATTALDSPAVTPRNMF
ncbi:carbohydrate esterase [Thraustotheca clavata]|uniref:Carbohydrate esterase n=1 Tax=Thraustotheca clavata TaxID=74557 RepID=A0A1W0A718_9STRA|nr:carbohydrate esterase [Thraustotheca clavata]